MTNRTTDTTWFDEAVRFAVQSHAGQARKGTSIPYIVHPLRVALTLERYRFPRPVIIAGLLHDVLEDCGVDVSEIAITFGAEVAALVSAVTERKTEAGKRRPWRVRKEEALAKIEKLPRQVAGLKAADALDNVRSSLAHHREIGDQLWERFNAGAADQTWYYGTLAKTIATTLGDHPLAQNLQEAVEKLIALGTGSPPG